MLAIIVGAVLFAIPISILVLQRVSGPSPYEQLEEMWKDPKQRSRMRRMIFGRKPPSKVPPPRLPLPPLPADELGHDKTEAQLIEEVRDDATRMVYADWLEQRGELVKAGYVRGEPVDRDTLAEATTFTWRAAISNAAVPAHECETVCWSELRMVPGDALVRECPYCTQPVRYCANSGEQRISASRDELAILDPAAPY
jgi:uncharacterized protein (TIGR02996 family)